MKGMENLTYQPDAAYVAACGLYCGACRKFVKMNNAPDAGRIKKRTGVKYGHVTSSITIKVVPTAQSVLSMNARSSITSSEKYFLSSSVPTVRPVSEGYRPIGYDAFAREMHAKKQQTIKR